MPMIARFEFLASYRKMYKITAFFKFCKIAWASSLNVKMLDANFLRHNWTNHCTAGKMSHYSSLIAVSVIIEQITLGSL